MLDDIMFTAPDGSLIQGALQSGGEDFWPVAWDDASDGDRFDEYRGDGPGGTDWETVQANGSTVYLDHSGQDWLGRHLIPAGSPPLPAAACNIMRHETAIARLLEAMTQRAQSISADDQARLGVQGFIEKLRGEIVLTRKHIEMERGA